MSDISSTYFRHTAQGLSFPGLKPLVVLLDGPVDVADDIVADVVATEGASTVFEVRVDRAVIAARKRLEAVGAAVKMDIGIRMNLAWEGPDVETLVTVPLSRGRSSFVETSTLVPALKRPSRRKASLPPSPIGVPVFDAAGKCRDHDVSVFQLDQYGVIRVDAGGRLMVRLDAGVTRCVVPCSKLWYQTGAPRRKMPSLRRATTRPFTAGCPGLSGPPRHADDSGLRRRSAGGSPASR